MVCGLANLLNKEHYSTFLQNLLVDCHKNSLLKTQLNIYVKPLIYNTYIKKKKKFMLKINL